MIYFGGYSYNEDVNDYGATDRVAEFKNLEWKPLDNLVRPRLVHSSIKMGTFIYTFGGANDNLNIR